MIATICIIQYAVKIIKNPIIAEVTAFLPFAVDSGFDEPAPIIIEIPPKIRRASNITEAIEIAVKSTTLTKSAKPLSYPHLTSKTLCIGIAAK